MNHRKFKHCLADQDACISWFDDDGSAYCHHCRTTTYNARAVARHSRKSTMEIPRVEEKEPRLGSATEP